MPKEYLYPFILVKLVFTCNGCAFSFVFCKFWVS